MKVGRLSAAISLTLVNLSHSYSRSSLPKMSVTGKDILQRVATALDHEKSFFLCKTSNVHVLTSLSVTFNQLKRVSDEVIQAKFGPLRQQAEHEFVLIFPILERTMKRARACIVRRMTERMSKIHPWRIIFEISLPREASMD